MTEPGCHVATETAIELSERHAKRHPHGLLDSRLRAQREQPLADAFGTVLIGDEVEHGVRQVAVAVSKACH